MNKYLKTGILVAVVGIVIVLVVVIGKTYAMEAESDEIVDQVEESTTMSLQTFKMLNNNVSKNDKLDFEILYHSTKKISSCSLWLRNKNYQNVLYYGIEDLDTKPYILLEDEYGMGAMVMPGEYEITGMTCYPEGMFEPIYFDSEGSYGTQFDFESPITVKEDLEDLENLTSSFKLYDFRLNTREAFIGDAVDVLFVNNTNSISTLLSFYNKEKDKEFSVYLKGLERTYFNVPSTAVEGEYELQYILTKDLYHSYLMLNNDGEVQLYEDGNLTKNQLQIDWNQTLTINTKNEPVDDLVFLFNNKDYNEEVRNQISDLDDKAVITVNANDNSIISQEIFEMLKGTRRTLIIEYGESEWVFHGKDIENSKNIDVTMLLNDITTKNFDGSFIQKLPSKSKMLRFADNGDLPGKVLIRLSSFELDKMFVEDNLYVYYYEKNDDNLLNVAYEIQKANGYYEFYINHNSDYILTGEALKGNYISKDEKLMKLNDQTFKSLDDDKNTYLYWGVGIGIFVFAILLIFLVRKKRRK